MVSGEEVGDIFRDGKAYDVMVWTTPETRGSLTDIGRLLLDTPGGVTSVWTGGRRGHQPAPNVIQREADSRRIDIGARRRGT